MPSFIKRHILTATIAVSSAALLYGGMTFAREQQVRDDRVPQVAATASPTFDDHGGLLETEAPENEPEASDDNGNDRVAETPEPTESFDDHGGNGTDDGADDNASPTASPDDHGGSSGSDGSDDSTKPAATPKPTSSPDDNGGNGSDG
ncbi:MAG: hypothetical protein HY263_10610 [Chloroflexi bacterium]|nr:hypothetical protein [Chloroflexota bacterium]